MEQLKNKRNEVSREYKQNKEKKQQL